MFSVSLREYAVPILAALVLHLVLAGFIFNSWSLSTPELQVPQPRVVMARVVELSRPQPVKKKQLAKNKPKPEPKAKEKSKPVEKKKPEIDKKALEAERLRQERLTREEELHDLLEEEDQQVQAEAEQKEIARYMIGVREEIAQNWSRPPSARNGMLVRLSLQLVPSGDVVGVTVLQSSGNDALDLSAQLAVQRVGRFEAVRGMPGGLFEKYFRQLTINFQPEDMLR